MENASRALLIAAGVLIAIILITLLIKTYGNIASFQRQKISVEEAEKIDAYNKEYTKYENRYVYGTEVITAINRAVNSKDSNCKVYIKFGYKAYQYSIVDLSNGIRTTKTITVNPNATLTVDPEDKRYTELFLDYENNKLAIDDLKNRYFKCAGIEYDQSTGKVIGITFEEKARQ